MERDKAFVYIDTNFKEDDGIFLNMALGSFSFELVGLSSNRSYMSSEAAGENILGLVNSYGLYLPVARNYDDRESAKDIKIYQAEDDYLVDADAYNNIYDVLTDCGKVDIIITGEPGNLVKALKEYEGLSDFIGHLFMVLPKKASKEVLKDFDYILGLDLDLFILREEFADKFILDEADLRAVFKENPSLGELLNYYKKSPKSLLSPLLLYLLESPEAFIFDELGLRLNKEELTFDMTESRKKAYVVNRVNEESFYDYLRGKLC